MTRYEKLSKAGNSRHYEKPYWRLYKLLLRNARIRKVSVTLSYEQYRRLIQKNPRCFYCNKKLKWVKHGWVSAVNLDRKNNKSSYNIRNVVASCPRCNRARGFGFTFKQWFKMTRSLWEKIK